MSSPLTSFKGFQRHTLSTKNSSMVNQSSEVAYVGKIHCVVMSRCTKFCISNGVRQGGAYRVQTDGQTGEHRRAWLKAPYVGRGLTNGAL